MDPKKNTLIKGIRLYLIINGILLMLAVIIGLVITMYMFLKEGKISHGHYSVGQIYLFVPFKETVLSPFLDGLITILIGLVISWSMLAIMAYLLKFSNNLISSKILCKENGYYLSRSGWILSFATFVYQTRDLLLNVNNNNIIANSTTAVKLIFAVFMIVFSAVMHPLFWLGMFAILFGKILDMASEVKQENDLTI